MALCPVDIPKPILPPTDLEKMKAELEEISRLLGLINSERANKEVYENLREAIEKTNEIILSLDNSNDFYKIGGFNRLMPLLACSNTDVVIATAELIGDLCQNNRFCQVHMLNLNVIPQLVALIDMGSKPKVCSKALYALSCLCRHNDEAIKQLEISNFHLVLFHLIEQPDERLRAKAAFFLSYLASFSSFREAFYRADIIDILLKLLHQEQSASLEHLLSALETQVSHHKQSRIQCRLEKYELKQLLLTKIESYQSESKYNEVVQYCKKIIDVCFHDQKDS